MGDRVANWDNQFFSETGRGTRVFLRIVQGDGAKIKTKNTGLFARDEHDHGGELFIGSLNVFVRNLDSSS